MQPCGGEGTRQRSRNSSEAMHGGEDQGSWEPPNGTSWKMMEDDGRWMEDVWEMMEDDGRCMEDVRKMYGRCTEDVWEMMEDDGR